MEKYGIVQDLNDWLEIRLLRNSLTHEYLTDDVAIAKNINAAFSAYTTLIDTLNRIKAYDKKTYKTRNIDRIVKKESGKSTIKGVKNAMPKLQRGRNGQGNRANGTPEG